MTNEELKNALLFNDAVRYSLTDGTSAEYTVIGIVYRRDDKCGIRVSAELLDKCGRCVVYADPRRIERIG